MKAANNGLLAPELAAGIIFCIVPAPRTTWNSAPVALDARTQEGLTTLVP
jgi:hypothetical protein